MPSCRTVTDTRLPSLPLLDYNSRSKVLTHPARQVLALAVRQPLGASPDLSRTGKLAEAGCLEQEGQHQGSSVPSAICEPSHSHRRRLGHALGLYHWASRAFLRGPGLMPPYPQAYHLSQTSYLPLPSNPHASQENIRVQ